MGDEDVMDQAMSPAGTQTAATVGSEAGVARRRWFKALLIGGALLGAAAIIGVAGPEFGYLILDPLTRHVGVLLMGSLALLIAASILMPPLPLWGNIPRVLVAVGLGLVLAVVALLSAWSAMLGETRYESPDGRSVLVVSEGADMIDPLWHLTVQQSSPGLAKTWYLACFNGDDPDNGLASVHWVSSTVVEMKTESGRMFQIGIDPSDSQPSTTASVSCSD